MHISKLRKALRDHKVPIDLHTLEEMTEMILRTDNYYHGWLLEKCASLKTLTD
jgi:hypothetical protein